MQETQYIDLMPIDRKIVISNKKTKQVQLFDPGCGVLLTSFGQDFHGFEDEIEEMPHGVAVNSKGQILIEIHFT